MGLKTKSVLPVVFWVGLVPRSFLEFTVKPSDARVTNICVAFIAAEHLLHLVWPLFAEIAILAFEHLVQVAFGFFDGHIRLSPAGHRSWIDSLREIFGLVHGVLGGYGARSPVAIAEIKRKFRRPSVLTYRQTGNPTHFCFPQKDQAVSFSKAHRTIK